MPSSVVLVQGTTLRVSVTSVDTTEPSPMPPMASLDCIGREIQYQSGSANEIDTTTFCSTGKEFRLGLEDPGQFTFNGHWVQTTPAHAVIRAAAIDKKSRLFIVTFEDGSTFAALGFVSQRSFSAAVDGVVTGSFTIRLTGATNETELGGLQISGTPVLTGEAGTAYTWTATATGGTPPHVFSISGAPSGMTVNASTGVVTWASPVVGNYPGIVVTVTDANNVPKSLPAFTLSITS